MPRLPDPTPLSLRLQAKADRIRQAAIENPELVDAVDSWVADLLEQVATIAEDAGATTPAEFEQRVCLVKANWEPAQFSGQPALKIAAQDCERFDGVITPNGPHFGV